MAGVRHADAVAQVRLDLGVDARDERLLRLRGDRQRTLDQAQGDRIGLVEEVVREAEQGGSAGVTGHPRSVPASRR